MSDLFYVGSCELCGEAVESNDGSPHDMLIRRWPDGDVTVEHTACVAKEMGVSGQRADEYRPHGYMSDKRAAEYIDGLMEDAFVRGTSYDIATPVAENH